MRRVLFPRLLHQIRRQPCSDQGRQRIQKWRERDDVDDHPGKAERPFVLLRPGFQCGIIHHAQGGEGKIFPRHHIAGDDEGDDDVEQREGQQEHKAHGAQHINADIFEGEANEAQIR